jgi:hypothetical protein
MEALVTRVVVNVFRFPYRLLIISSDFNNTWILSTDFNKSSQTNFHENQFDMRRGFFVRTVWQLDMTKLLESSCFRGFAHPSKVSPSALELTKLFFYKPWLPSELISDFKFGDRTSTMSSSFRNNFCKKRDLAKPGNFLTKTCCLSHHRIKSFFRFCFVFSSTLQLCLTTFSLYLWHFSP